MTNELKALFKTDRIPLVSSTMDKQVSLIFGGDIATITNTKLVEDTFELTEKICSVTYMQYGACESAILRLTVADVEDNLKGQEFELKTTANNEDVQLGFFTVDSAKKQTDLRFKDIVAYDRMKKFDIDVSDWYNALNFTGMTLAQFRSSLCDYCGVVEDSFTALPNDSMTVEKTITATEFSGREVLFACEQLNGCFGQIGRNGKLRHVILPTSPVETITTEMLTSPAEFEEYTVKAIDKIQIKSEGDDIGGIYGSGTNAFIIQGNFLCYGKNASELNAIAQNLSVNVFNRPYTPCKADVIGLPYVMPGDLITIDNKTTYVMQRTLTGIQALSDNYMARGSEYASNIIASNTEIKALKSKVHKIVNTVEEMTSTITDLENKTETSISQLSDSIDLKVSKDDVIAEINLSPEEIQISADKIDLTGYATFIDLETEGNTVINGANITTGIVKSANWLDSEGERTGEGSQINLETGESVFSGQYNYAWLDNPAEQHYAYVSLQNGRIKVADVTDQQALYFSHEGISTTASGNNATGVIDFRSHVFGSSLDGSEYNGLNIRTNGSPVSMQSLRSHAHIAPKSLQAVVDGSNPDVFDKFTFDMKKRWNETDGVIDYTNKIQNGDGLMYWGTRELVDGSWRYREGFQFSSDDNNRYIKCVDGDGGLVDIKAKNVQGVTDYIFGCNEDGQVIVLTETLDDGTIATTTMTYDNDGKVATVDGAPCTWRIVT